MWQWCASGGFGQLQRSQKRGASGAASRSCDRTFKGHLYGLAERYCSTCLWHPCTVALVSVRDGEVACVKVSQKPTQGMTVEESGHSQLMLPAGRQLVRCAEAMDCSVCFKGQDY